MTPNISATGPRAVTFSRFSELAFIPKDDNSSNNWYSSKDNLSFRQALVQDARRMSREIQGAPLDAKILRENLYGCVGIEKFVTKGLAREIQETRRAHVNAVLSEQSLQRQQGVCDIEKLSSVSNKTQWTKERARILATGYSKLLRD